MEPTVKVWDPFVRIFHWTLAAGFLADYFWLEGGKDYFGAYKLHDWLGYGLGALVAVRIVWGFAGPRHARFADFVTGPRKFFAHMKATFSGREPRYLGHNPAGGAMILALLAMIPVLCATGWMQSLDAFWGVLWVQDLHVLLSHVIIGLVGVHVLAVIGVSWMLRENLVAAMFTGRKRALPAEPAPRDRGPSPEIPSLLGASHRSARRRRR